MAWFELAFHCRVQGPTENLEAQARRVMGRLMDRGLSDVAMAVHLEESTVDTEFPVAAGDESAALRDGLSRLGQAIDRAGASVQRGGYERAPRPPGRATTWIVESSLITTPGLAAELPDLLHYSGDRIRSRAS